ncbi:hypothetical protein Poli38472_006511 [Pythium oligandrum]|uniref:Conserved oligomeric Golgi complex subunit 8 n=1 Tax=Pythium oligandrum TaxID=41045 RepID=A0A8K1C4X4_PYTOL|nr:hypothetical protein Poli38472_006511 [Pythium oligandrum]|eukprot:TMW56501.1 hypothetical protein Poli38472_006511 [Pythium oligandrum]
MMEALRTASSLEELKKEPWRLQIQADTTAEQLRGLVLKNYHVFIRSNQCAAVVKGELHELKEQTTEIMREIPELKEFSTHTQEETAQIVTKHGDIQFVFDHYLQLTELLEIPQLLEACIHNELFDSALDVIQFAKETFEDNSKVSNVVIQALVREVTQMTGVLREKLLQKLREDLQLALCVRIVSFLRRLDALTDGSGHVGSIDHERQLKEEFLSCRSAWLASLTRTITTNDPYQYTVQLIDVKRTSWFDMITQYSAIFGNETVDGKVDPPLCRWATSTVADFIQILMKQLPKIDDFSSLATILEQSLFFGGSLGRVGVDFRAILVVYFEDHIVELLASSWQTACRDFKANLSLHALGGGGSTMSATPIVLASYRNSMNGNGSGTASPFQPRVPSNDEDVSPPRVLMSFPLLAEFTNALLTSFNDLRLCTLASLNSRLAGRLHQTLATLVLCVHEFCVKNSLLVDQDGAKSSKAASLHDAVSDMNEVIASDLLPYVARCFQRLFPSVNIRSSSLAALNVLALLELMRERQLLRPVDANET